MNVCHILFHLESYSERSELSAHTHTHTHTHTQEIGRFGRFCQNVKRISRLIFYKIEWLFSYVIVKNFIIVKSLKNVRL